jgi:dihydrofolate reductase
VIVGRKPIGSSPGSQALPKRRNILLSRQQIELPGFETAHSPEEAAAMAAGDGKVFVIGGGTVYRQMLPMCDRAIITKVHTTAPCDTWFPNLDESPEWAMTEIIESGEENGIGYEMCVYCRQK